MHGILLAAAMFAAPSGFVSVEMGSGCAPGALCASYVVAANRPSPPICSVLNTTQGPAIGDYRMTIVPVLENRGNRYSLRLNWWNLTGDSISPRMAVAYYDCKR